MTTRKYFSGGKAQRARKADNLIAISNPIRFTKYRINKARRMRWAGHETRMGEKKNANKNGKARGKEATRKTKT
jgi:hypothetical protein